MKSDKLHSRCLLICLLLLLASVNAKLGSPKNAQEQLSDPSWLRKLKKHHTKGSSSPKASKEYRSSKSNKASKYDPHDKVDASDESDESGDSYPKESPAREPPTPYPVVASPASSDEDSPDFIEGQEDARTNDDESEDDTKNTATETPVASPTYNTIENPTDEDDDDDEEVASPPVTTDDTGEEGVETETLKPVESPTEQPEVIPTDSRVETPLPTSASASDVESDESGAEESNGDGSQSTTSTSSPAETSTEMPQNTLNGTTAPTPSPSSLDTPAPTHSPSANGSILDTSAPTPSPSTLHTSTLTTSPSVGGSVLETEVPSSLAVVSPTPMPIPELVEVAGRISCSNIGAATGIDIEDRRELLMSFVYQIWLDDDAVDISSVSPQVERGMTRAVADALLNCRTGRRLAEGILAISASPNDAVSGSCATNCYVMDGAITLEASGTTGQEEMIQVCRALRVVQDDALATNLATSIDGVGAIRYRSSSIWCGDGVDGVQEDENNQMRSSAGDSSLGGGAAFGIAFAGIVVLALVLFTIRRRRDPANDYITEAPSKDMTSLQHANSASISSPRTAFFHGGGYTILADNQSMRSEGEEPESVPSSPLPVHAMSKKEEVSPTRGVDLFNVDKDNIDVPAGVSLQSSEGGSVDEEEDENSYVDNGEDDDSGANMNYATPFRISPSKPEKNVSSPGLSSDSSPEKTNEDLEDKNISSPTYPGISSLLGGNVSEGSTTDEDRSVMQLMDGGVSLLKMSDLESAYEEENSSLSPTSSHDQVEK